MRGELGLEVGGAGPLGGVHLHAGLDQRSQVVRQSFQVGALTQQHEHRLDRVGPVEGGMPGGGEDEGGAEREDVAGPGDAAGVPGLFGRHVRGGADGDVRHGQAGVGDAGRDTEVDHPGAVLDDEDVGRLEVAVDETRAVDGLEGLGDTGGQPAHGLRRHGTALVHYLFERGRGHIGGGEPGHGGPRVGVDHGGGVEPADGAGGLDLAREADPEELVLGELGPHRLDRHPPAGRRAGEIDQPHAAGPEPSQHLERADPSRVVLRQLLHHVPATSPYGPRRRSPRITARSNPALRAPRFFLARAPVANPGADRGVPCHFIPYPCTPDSPRPVRGAVRWAAVRRRRPPGRRGARPSCRRGCRRAAGRPGRRAVRRVPRRRRSRRRRSR